MARVRSDNDARYALRTSFVDENGDVLEAPIVIGGGFTESDPIFTASPAFGISSSDITNWNTAYGWGDHSTAGYATSSTLSGYLRSDVDDTFTGDLATEGGTNGIRFGHANETNNDDGVIATHRFGSGLNIVGVQTVAAQGREIRMWGDVILEDQIVFHWNGADPMILADNADGPLTLFSFRPDTIASTDWVDFNYRTSPKTVQFERQSDGADIMRLKPSDLSVRTGGEIQAVGDVIAYYSDERLKDVSGAIERPLEKISQIDGVYYTPSEKARELGYTDSERQVGLLAQQVQAVLPEVVRRAPVDDDGEGGSVSGEDYITLKYERIVALLVEGIKELSARVEELENGS